MFGKGYFPGKKEQEFCEEGPGGTVNGGGGELYSYIFMLDSCSALLVSFKSGKISFVFTVCEHEYMNIAPNQRCSAVPELTIAILTMFIQGGPEKRLPFEIQISHSKVI